ncbi:MAG: AMP-binding protein, partial [Phycisphaerales bacterium]|nr:AMP-binding protein [Phycisphaerales bacterium]
MPLVEQIWDELSGVEGVVVMTDSAHMPTSARIGNLICYETLIESHSDDFVWPRFDENTASSMCYTSGTTGNPKGVLYTHRANVLHSYGAALPDALNLSARDAVMPVVPMFHANAWGLPYTATMVGAKLVLPGPHLDGKSVQELITSEVEHVLVGGAGVLGERRVDGTQRRHFRHAPRVPDLDTVLLLELLHHRARTGRTADDAVPERLHVEPALVEILEQHQPDGRHGGAEGDALARDQLLHALAVEVRAGQHELRADHGRRVGQAPGVGMEHRHHRH